MQIVPVCSFCGLERVVLWNRVDRKRHLHTRIHMAQDIAGAQQDTRRGDNNMSAIHDRMVDIQEGDVDRKPDLVLEQDAPGPCQELPNATHHQ